MIELPSRDLDVLHFATHAVIRKDAPEQSALFLSEYAADGSPLPSDRLTTEDITRSGLRADVVVLSGCATGDGRELRGEGVLGLTYGFLANGSQHRGRIVVAGRRRADRALHGRVLHGLSRVRPRGRRAANRAIAHPQQGRAHGLVEFRGALQRHAVNGALRFAGALPNYLTPGRIGRAIRPRRRARPSPTNPPTICYKCHDFAISPTCRRIRGNYFSPDLLQTLPTKSRFNCGTMRAPSKHLAPARGVSLHVIARSRRYRFPSAFADRRTHRFLRRLRLHDCRVHWRIGPRAYRSSLIRYCRFGY